VTGPNGAGKTNLLESLHVGTQGFSPRTRADAQLVRFGREAARVALRGSRAGVPLELEVTLELGSGKRATLNGAKLRAAEQLRGEVTTLVFTPDRLVVVKGGPAARRAYFDRVLGRLAPSRAGLSAGTALRLGAGTPRCGRVAQGSRGGARCRGTAGVAHWPQLSRRGTRRSRPNRIRQRAGELGLQQAELRHEGEAPSVEELERRLDAISSAGDGRRATSTTGVLSAGRDLRTFGSQGEQRLAVLSLLLGEAELLEERRGTRPLLLLDDVLSELDPERRRILADRVRASGQALVTSASRSALPGEPAQTLEVSQREDGTSEVR
jgi:DNA replication and repair protein RecF